jgi:hypothetical protein
MLVASCTLVFRSHENASFVELNFPPSLMVIKKFRNTNLIWSDDDTTHHAHKGANPSLGGTTRNHLAKKFKKVGLIFFFKKNSLFLFNPYFSIG